MTTGAQTPQARQYFPEIATSQPPAGQCGAGDQYNPHLSGCEGEGEYSALELDPFGFSFPSSTGCRPKGGSKSIRREGIWIPRPCRQGGEPSVTIGPR